MSETITLIFADENEQEISIELPAKRIVCTECGGTGFVLAGGLRGESFTESEFYETFEDPEDRAEYFRPGGKYDTQCDLCHGKNVIVVVDEDRLTDAQNLQFEAYNEWVNENEPGDWRDDPEARAERRMGA